MKIRSVTTLTFNPEVYYGRGSFNYCYVRIETENGLVGYGECSLMPGAVAGAVDTIGDYLIGRDARRVEQIWSSMYYMWHNIRGGVVFMSAMSGIDIALWDIKAKAAGLPIYEMLGGPIRTRLRCYRGVGGATTDELVENAKEAVADGWTAMKFDPLSTAGYYLTAAQFEEAFEKVGAVRAAVGPDVDLMVETHGRLNLAMIRKLAEGIAEFKPMFLEEPCGPEYTSAMEKLSQETTVPLATGERLYTRWGFRELFEREAVAYAQPDIGHSGGITELRKIASMAEAYGIAVAPHNPFSVLNFVASAQVDASIPNFFIQESGNFAIDGLLKEPVRIVDGHYDLPTGPGLGVEPDEDFIAAHPPQPVEPERWAESNRWAGPTPLLAEKSSSSPEIPGGRTGRRRPSRPRAAGGPAWQRFGWGSSAAATLCQPTFRGCSISTTWKSWGWPIRVRLPLLE